MRFLSRVSSQLRTLRVRLTIWNTAVVLIAVVVALLAVREGLRFYLLAETDAVLDDEVKELLLAIEQWHPDQQQIIAEMERKAEGHKARDWHIRWLAPDHHTTIWASSNAPPAPLVRSATSFQGHRVFVSATRRSVERQCDRPGLPKYYVRVGATMSFIDADVNRLTRILAPVGLAILLLAPLGGSLLAERAIDPLQQIITTTDRLHPSQLNERLKVRGVGDELDQLAQKINQFLDQIADHLRRNRDFVANAAHELRSPLTAIQSSVEVALDKPRSLEEYQELLYLIDDECRHLASLVNQLLQLAEAEAEAPEAHWTLVPMDELARRSVEMFGPVGEERGVSLSAELEPLSLVRGNRQQLRQVVTNLVDNAIKFTPAGGQVVVAVRHDRAARRVRLEVRDTGIGIPPTELPRIFERFYQVDKSRARAGEPRGNGLGLSLCEAIVARHRGKIEVESQLGVGTVFRVLLPAASADQPPSAAEA